MSQNEIADAAPMDALDAFEWFLRVEVAGGDASPDTITLYRREVGAWLEWCARHEIEALSATRVDVERYREQGRAAGLAPATISLKMSVVRRFYDAALRHDLINKNPAQGVHGGRDNSAAEDKIKALSQGGLAALVALLPSETIADVRDRALIGLMAIHGLRRVEAHRLNHEHICEDESAPWAEVEGKGGKMRHIFLRADTLAALQTYKTAKLGAGLSLAGAVFVSHSNNARGQRLSRQALNVIVDKRLSAAKLKKAGISCHALRHTFGTLAVAGGAKIEHLRDAMGHAHIETTSIYVRAVEKARNNPANFIDVEL